MKYYSIVLSALFLAVPTHPINIHSLVTTSAGCITAVRAFHLVVGELKFIKKSRYESSFDSKESIYLISHETMVVAVCVKLLYDKHKPYLATLLDKSNNKSDKYRK